MRYVLGDYEFWHIYSIATRDCRFPGSCLEIRQIDDPLFLKSQDMDDDLRKSDWSGPGAVGFLANIEGEPAAVCWYWTGAAMADRNVGLLDANEAELIQITVAKRFRRRGVGRSLIAETGARMKKHGYTRLYAQIWHSNRPSKKAFRAAGWRQVGIVYRVAPVWLHKPLQLRRKTRWAAQAADILNRWQRP